MSLIDNGVIALENSDDVDICEGDSPVGQIFGDGSGASSVASATYGTISYQWQRSVNNGLSYQDIVGATLANYSPTSITTTTLFRRNVVISSSSTSCTFIGDDIVAMNLRPKFEINLTTNDPTNTFCQDQDIIVSADTGAVTLSLIHISEPTRPY